jgi:hypothetical protein
MSEPSRNTIIWSPEARVRIREAIYRFHVQEFGEEMARVNFLPLDQRKAYVAEMIEHAEHKRAKCEKPDIT